MAADLHIHAFAEGELTEEDFKKFFCHSLGSKFCDLSRNSKYDLANFDKFAKTPNVHVCEVSWLKASLFDDSDTFIPSVAEQVSEIVGEDQPVIDDDFIGKIAKAFESDNRTGYDVSEVQGVIDFLKEHKGKRAFKISW